MKALEVLINDKAIGFYVPPEGECFSVMMANIPRTYMRAQVMSGNQTESWYWQLPDINENDTIAFRLVETNGRTGIPPQRVEPKDSTKTKALQRKAASAWARAKKKAKAKKKPVPKRKRLS